MNFRVNVDRPERKATIHSVNSGPRCQPDENPKKHGYWTDPVATKEEAFQAAKESGWKPHLCQLCWPLTA